MTVHYTLMSDGRSGVEDMGCGVREAERGAEKQKRKMNGGDDVVLREDCALIVGGRQNK